MFLFQRLYKQTIYHGYDKKYDLTRKNEYVACLYVCYGFA